MDQINNCRFQLNDFPQPLSPLQLRISLEDGKMLSAFAYVGGSGIIDLKNGSLNIPGNKETAHVVFGNNRGQFRIYSDGKISVKHQDLQLGQKFYEIEVVDSKIKSLTRYDKFVHRQHQTVCYSVQSGPCKLLQRLADEKYDRRKKRNEENRVIYND
jgi:hypothetical protein